MGLKNVQRTFLITLKYFYVERIIIFLFNSVNSNLLFLFYISATIKKYNKFMIENKAK